MGIADRYAGEAEKLTSVSFRGPDPYLDAMGTLRLTLSLALVAVLVAAPAALAQKPPDNGAVDQYTEGLPGPEGETPSGGGGGSGGGAGGGSGGEGALPPSAVEALEAEGSDGEAVARIVEGTAPRGSGERGPAGSGGERAASAEESGGLIDSVQAAVTGEEGGMGIVFPLILGGSLLGAVVLLLLGRRGGGPTPD